MVHGMTGDEWRKADRLWKRATEIEAQSNDTPRVEDRKKMRAEANLMRREAQRLAGLV